MGVAPVLGAADVAPRDRRLHGHVRRSRLASIPLVYRVEAATPLCLRPLSLFDLVLRHNSGEAPGRLLDHVASATVCELLRQVAGTFRVNLHPGVGAQIKGVHVLRFLRHLEDAAVKYEIVLVVDERVACATLNLSELSTYLWDFTFLLDQGPGVVA